MIFARWAVAISALGIIGSFGATLLNYPVSVGVIRVGRRASLGLVLACFLIITSQLYIWFGAEGLTDPANVTTMLTITLWGLHWSWLAAVAVTTVVAFGVAGRWLGMWIYVAGACALAVAATVPLIGHGGTRDSLSWTLHAVHLLGAGLWIGSLMVATFAGIGDIDRLLTSLRRFAPIALTGASLVVVTGLVMAWQHLRPFSTLWTTDFGRTLLAKMVAVLSVGGLGFINWRGPRIQMVIAEVAVALVMVLGLTALLSELPMPGH